jgi:hypothetical protein
MEDERAKMKSTITQFLLIATALLAFAQGGIAAESGEFAPERFEPSRYRAELIASPFEREILRVEEPRSPLARRELKLIGIIGEAGAYKIIVIDTDGQYQVVTGEPNVEGLCYTDLIATEKIQDCRVEISRGRQAEWVTFDHTRFLMRSGAAEAKSNSNSKTVWVRARQK